VLERRAGLSFAGQDVYVSVVGGIRIVEPAVDLPLALALASALKDVPLPYDMAAFGELGLTGQVRPVSQAAARIRESVSLGMGRVFGAAPSSLGAADSANLERVATAADAVRLLV
jgi:DNA repair protein RadA/Sms